MIHKNHKLNSLKIIKAKTTLLKSMITCPDVVSRIVKELLFLMKKMIKKTVKKN